MLKKECWYLAEILLRQERVDSLDEARQRFAREVNFSFSTEVLDAGKSWERECLLASFVQTPNSVVFKRIDKNLLAMTPCRESFYNMDAGCRIHNVKYFAVVGKKIVELEQLIDNEENSHFVPNVRTHAEKIGAQLKSFGIVPDCIVEYEYKYNSINNDNPDDPVINIVVYKNKEKEIMKCVCGNEIDFKSLGIDEALIAIQQHDCFTGAIGCIYRKGHDSTYRDSNIQNPCEAISCTDGNFYAELHKGHGRVM